MFESKDNEEVGKEGREAIRGVVPDYSRESSTEGSSEVGRELSFPVKEALNQSEIAKELSYLARALTHKHIQTIVSYTHFVVRELMKQGIDLDYSVSVTNKKDGGFRIIIDTSIVDMDIDYLMKHGRKLKSIAWGRQATDKLLRSIKEELMKREEEQSIKEIYKKIVGTQQT